MELKIKHLTIKNIKNVKFGEIDFTDSKGDFLNITAIYGQNGSGKTTIVEVFEIIKELLSGNQIPQKTAGIFSDDFENPSEIILEVEQVGQYLMKYEAQFFATTINNGQHFAIVNEKISSKMVGFRKRYKTILHYSISGTVTNSAGENSLDSNLYSEKKVATPDAINILSYNSFKESSSFIFRDDFLKLIESKQNSLDEITLNIDILKKLASNFRIYTSEFSGMISGNNMALIGVNINHNKQKLQGILPFSLQQNGMSVPEELIPAYTETIQYMNEVLPAIIPNLMIQFEEGETETTQEQIKLKKLNFFAIRSGKKFSLIHESEGIKKIIGMIGYLVEVYNNPNIIAVIDELDSGVFEYLLGELIQIFSEGAKGQLIFTSHNLRILEKLPVNKIIFSTTKDTQRYIRLKGLKPSNNLRDYYLRALQIEGQEEELYLGHSKSSIRRSLRKAGRKLGK